MVALVQIFSIFSLVLICKSSYPQYGPLSRYDAHPYIMGWPDKSIFADRICKIHGSRLCTCSDIDNMALTRDIYFCELAWAYNHYFNHVFGHMATSKTESCFKYHHFLQRAALGVFPNVIKNHPSIKGKYWCLYDAKHQSSNFECSGNGKDYKGLEFLTKSKKVCQNWALDFPNKPKESEKNMERNYCRNPDNSPRPWCYLSDQVGREDCDIECSLFGNFTECSVTLYMGENFFGPHYTISLDHGGQGKKDELDFQDFDNYVRSFKLRGDFCHVFLYENDFDSRSDSAIEHFQGYMEVKNLDKMSPYMKDYGISFAYLFDTSADVLLADERIQYVYQIADEPKAIKAYFKSLHECTIEEVQNAKFVARLISNLPNFGLVNIKINKPNAFGYSKMLYTHGSPLKKSWCCLNEYPVLTENLVDKNVALSACSNMSRNETVMRKGRNVRYTHFKRLCTIGDIQSHFTNYLKNAPGGWVAVSKNKVTYCGSKNDRLFKESSHEKAKAWCCDKDCLPLKYHCIHHNQCCTLKCIKGRCELRETQVIEGENTPEVILTKKHRIVMCVVWFFVAGFLLRCCCPKQRLVSRHVKKHFE